MAHHATIPVDKPDVLDFGANSVTSSHLAEVRHRAAEFCDFDVEIGESLLFTIGIFRKAM